MDDPVLLRVSTDGATYKNDGTWYYSNVVRFEKPGMGTLYAKLTPDSMDQATGRVMFILYAIQP